MARMRQNIVVGAPEVKSSGAAWIGQAGINPLQTPHSASIRVAALPAVNRFSPAGYISEDGVTKTVDRDTDTPYRSYIFDIHGGDGLKGRLFIPNGRVSELDDQVFSRSEVVGFDATIECFPDDNDNKLYTYIDRREVKHDEDDRFPDDGLPVVSLAEIEDIVRNALNGLPISPDLVAGLFYSLIDGKGGLNLDFVEKLVNHLRPLDGVDDFLKLLADLLEGADTATLIHDVEALPFTPLNKYHRWAQSVIDLLTGAGGRQTLDDLTGGIF